MVDLSKPNLLKLAFIGVIAGALVVCVVLIIVLPLTLITSSSNDGLKISTTTTISTTTLKKNLSSLACYQGDLNASVNSVFLSICPLGAKFCTNDLVGISRKYACSPNCSSSNLTFCCNSSACNNIKPLTNVTSCFVGNYNTTTLTQPKNQTCLGPNNAFCQISTNSNTSILFGCASSSCVNNYLPPFTATICCPTNNCNQIPSITNQSVSSCFDNTLKNGSTPTQTNCSFPNNFGCSTYMDVFTEDLYYQCDDFECSVNATYFDNETFEVYQAVTCCYSNNCNKP